MEKVSNAWRADRKLWPLIPLPMPGRQTWYWIEAHHIVNYESGYDTRRSAATVRVRDDDGSLVERRIDVDVDVEWIDREFSTRTLWAIEPAVNEREADGQEDQSGSGPAEGGQLRGALSG